MLAGGSIARGSKAADLDIAILDGWVIDPESNTDTWLNVGVRSGEIVVLTKKPIVANKMLFASGCIVCPGFIDILAHGMDIENNRYQAMDGVTTVFELESGAEDVDAWYAERRGKRILNYGASAGHLHARRSVFPDEQDFEHKEATAEQIAQMAAHLERNLKAGAVAVGMAIEYCPGASREEVLEMFRLAAKYGASVHVHLRYGNMQPPGTAMEGLQDVLDYASQTKAALHVVHVPSMGLGNTRKLIEMIAAKQKAKMDITGDAYPYTAFATGISSAVFEEGWQQRFGIDYGDLQWAATGERLTKETFEKYRAQGGTVIAHAIPEDAVKAAMASPSLMVGSDGALTNGVGHPRSAGTFARLMGRYVREQKTVSLKQAVRKVTLMPARRLERRVPAMRQRGRIRIGCKADITVFDPFAIKDNATYQHPDRFSSGVKHLLVNGVAVVEDYRLLDGIFPGQPIRARVEKG